MPVKILLRGSGAAKFKSVGMQRLQAMRRLGQNGARWTQFLGARIRVTRRKKYEEILIMAAGEFVNRAYWRVQGDTAPDLAAMNSNSVYHPDGKSYLVGYGSGANPITLAGGYTEALLSGGGFKYEAPPEPLNFPERQEFATASDYNPPRDELRTMIYKMMDVGHYKNAFAMIGGVFANSFQDPLILTTPDNILTYAPGDTELSVGGLIGTQGGLIDIYSAVVNGEADYIIVSLIRPEVFFNSASTTITYEGIDTPFPDIARYFMLVIPLSVYLNGVESGAPVPATDFEIHNLLDEIPSGRFARGRGAYANTDETAGGEQSGADYTSWGSEPVLISPGGFGIAIWERLSVNASPTLGEVLYNGPAALSTSDMDSGGSHSTLEAHNFTYAGVPGVGGTLSRTQESPTLIFTAELTGFYTTSLAGGFFSSVTRIDDASFASSIYIAHETEGFVDVPISGGYDMFGTTISNEIYKPDDGLLFGGLNAFRVNNAQTNLALPGVSDWLPPRADIAKLKTTLELAETRLGHPIRQAAVRLDSPVALTIVNTTTSNSIDPYISFEVYHNGAFEESITFAEQQNSSGANLVTPDLWWHELLGQGISLATQAFTNQIVSFTHVSGTLYTISMPLEVYTFGPMATGYTSPESTNFMIQTSFYGKARFENNPDGDPWSGTISASNAYFRDGRFEVGQAIVVKDGAARAYSLLENNYMALGAIEADQAFRDTFWGYDATTGWHNGAVADDLIHSSVLII